ncbi:MAG: DUF177 domain-containing protein [Anaerolineae bacterium]|jgi:uncharacterized protein
MRYNVAQLLKGPTGARRRFEFKEEIRHLDPELHPLEPLEGTITMMRTSQGILVSGELQTVLLGECRRCLEQAEVEVVIELEEEFLPSVPIKDAPVDKVAEEDLDEALTIDEHHELDLSEVIRQGLWLAAPMDALCRPDCAGICPNCGGNRNLGECECSEPAIDPRWAALQVLLSEESDSEGKG